MGRSAFWGILIIAVLGLTPVLLLFLYGPASNNLLSYPEMTHKLGEIAALVGVTLFALTFVLSTRLRIIEEAFGGLDKVYLIHGIIGSIALVLLLSHPILLVLKFIPANFNLAATYLLPGTFWSVDFGIIALLSLATLVGITLYSRLKYQNWKFTHEFLGLVFIIAVLHIFLVRTDASRDYIFNGYYIFTTIVASIGIASFIYSFIIRNSAARHKTYRVKDIQEIGDVHRITFSPENSENDALKYKSGQFVFLRFFNKKVGIEQHPFSIASTSDDPELRVYVKKLGDYTNGLRHLKIGDKASIEGPYGKFNYEYNESGLDQIWIAGGIGITPFIGMVQDLDKDMKNKVTLYYAVNAEKELLELERFKSIEHNNKNFRIIPWIKDKGGFLNADIIKEHSGNLHNKEFYICGPPGMKSSLTKGLTDSGVEKNMIIMEDFAFR